MDFTGILSSLGPSALIVIGVVIVMENGLFIPFLPGDSLVFAAAILAAHLHVPWTLIAVVAALAAFTGSELGFALGHRFGPRLFKPGARVFSTRRLAEAERFFARWGPAAIVLGRSVPIIRTYLSSAAALAGMPRRTFTLWNAISAGIWAGFFSTAGALFGSVTWVAHNVGLISLGIVAVTVLPIVITEIIRSHSSHVGRRAPVETADKAGGTADSADTAEPADAPGTEREPAAGPSAQREREPH